jgi:hypothetical protein
MRDEAQAGNAVDDRPKNFLTEAEIASFPQGPYRLKRGILTLLGIVAAGRAVNGQKQALDRAEGAVVVAQVYVLQSRS